MQSWIEGQPECVTTEDGRNHTIIPFTKGEHTVNLDIRMIAAVTQKGLEDLLDSQIKEKTKC